MMQRLWCWLTNHKVVLYLGHLREKTGLDGVCKRCGKKFPTQKATYPWVHDEQ